MNKYQKAFDVTNTLLHLMCGETREDGYEPTMKEMTKAMADFQELVKKATPKKPNYEGDGYSNGELVYDTWICPNCKERYEVDYDNYRCCPNCGQALDWSEEVVDFFDKDIDDLNLSVRTHNCLARAGLRKISDVHDYWLKNKTFAYIRDMGKRSSEEVIDLFKQNGIDLE